MSNWPKLAVLFASDSILDLDVGAIHDQLCKCYKIGYTGLYDRGTHLSLYIQTESKGVKITPAKVLRICKEFGALETLPKTYKQREGLLVSEMGCFKKPGRQKGSRNKAVNSAVDGRVVNNNTTNITKNNHNDHSVTNIDNSVTNNTVYVYINPLGEEDMSHITMEQFKKVLGGGKEEIIHSMKTMMSAHDYEQIIEQAWHGLQETLYERQWEEQKSERAAAAIAESSTEPAAQKDSGSDTESDDSSNDGSSSEEDPTPTPFEYEAIEIDGQPIKYDGHLDSIYNKEAKRKVGRMSILERSAVVKSLELPYEFAELLFENPHNSNVKHSKKSGSIEYVDVKEKGWAAKPTYEVHRIVKNWGDKAKEYCALLEEKYGAEWSNTFDGFYATQVLKMFDYHHPSCSKILKVVDKHVKRCALLAIENSNKKVKRVKSRTGKTMKLVFSESDFEARDKKVLRNTTWAKIMSD